MTHEWKPGDRAVVTDEQIKHMANRFLGWKLPANFAPDAGITFDPVFNKGTPYEKRHEPSGTNLFDIRQTSDMVRHMVEGLPEIPVPAHDPLTELERRVVDMAIAWGGNTGSAFDNCDALQEAVDALLAAREAAKPDPVTQLKTALDKWRNRSGWELSDLDAEFMHTADAAIAALEAAR